MARDIGGPGGAGGPLGDAAVLKIPDVMEGRSLQDFGTRPETSEALETVNLPTSDNVVDPVQQYSVILEADDALICQRVTLDEDGEEVLSDLFFFIAKPPELRVASYDTDGEEDAEGFVVENDSAGRRKLTRTQGSGDFIKYERTVPAYNFEDRIFAALSGTTGVSGISLLDANVDARRWEPEEPRTKWFVVKDVDKDTLDCQEWDFQTGAEKVDDIGDLLPEVVVAKPHDLRGTSWKSIVIDGITYTTPDSAETDPFVERTGDDGSITEDQLVIPKFIVDATIISARREDLGTGAFRNSLETIWQDNNDAGRAFAEVS